MRDYTNILYFCYRKSKNPEESYYVCNSNHPTLGLKCQGDVVNTIEDCMPLRNKYKNIQKPS